MVREIPVYDLLLSCPGDVYEVCFSSIKDAVDNFNRDAGIHYSSEIRLKHWSRDTYPQSGGNPQDLINLQIVNSADIAIVIFWTRFGTPTDKYGSGTEEEIEQLLKANKQVFLYFLDKPVHPSMTDSPNYPENRKKIAKIKETYEGLYCIVRDEIELKDKIVEHLKLYFSKKNNKSINSKEDKLDKKWFRSDGKEISSDELIKIDNTSFQIDGDIIRTEMKTQDGRLVYMEFDTKKLAMKNIVLEGYPQEYKLNIPDDLIVKKHNKGVIINGIKYRIEECLLKFGGHSQIIYDTINNQIQNINIEAPAGKEVYISRMDKTISLIDKRKPI